MTSATRDGAPLRRRVARAGAVMVAVVVVVLATAWGALALYYLAPASDGARRALAWIVAAVGLVLVTALVAGRWRAPAAFAFGASLAVAGVAWTAATPSSTRDWQAEVAVLPSAVIEGDRVTVRNIRNFDYRTETDFTPAYYRVTAPIENGRRVFLDYMRDINRIAARPRFYNTLTTNCTTMILAHAAVNTGAVPYSWKILLSGYAPEYAYERGRLDRSVPFAELQRRSRINPAAQAADQAPDFSRRIRAGLP